MLKSQSRNNPLDSTALEMRKPTGESLDSFPVSAVYHYDDKRMLSCSVLSVPDRAIRGCCSSVSSLTTLSSRLTLDSGQFRFR